MRDGFDYPEHSTTAGMALMNAYYLNAGAYIPWTNRKVTLLCQLLNIIVEELAVICCLSRDKLRKYQREDSFPPEVSLHFIQLENWYLREVKGITKTIVGVAQAVNVLAEAKAKEAQYAD